MDWIVPVNISTSQRMERSYEQIHYDHSATGSTCFEDIGISPSPSIAHNMLVSSCCTLGVMVHMTPMTSQLTTKRRMMHHGTQNLKVETVGAIETTGTIQEEILQKWMTKKDPAMNHKAEDFSRRRQKPPTRVTEEPQIDETCAVPSTKSTSYSWTKRCGPTMD